MPSNSRNSYGFGLGGPLPALAPTPIISTRVPVAGDNIQEIGTTWINTTTNQAWTMTGSAAGAATWSLSSPGASDVDTLTGDAGGALSPVAGNINILGGATANVTGAGNTLTVNPSANGFPVSPYVVGAVGEAGYQTIAAAITAAAGSGTDQTIFVQPGTYTEDLTLVDGIDIKGSSYASTIITGTHIPPAAGNFVIQNCTLTDAGDIFNSAVAGTAVISVEDCIINCTNGYTFNLVNWTGTLGIYDSGDVSTANGWVNNTGAATIVATSSEVGVGAGNAFVISGNANIRDVEVRCPGTFQGALQVDIAHCIFLNTVTTAATVDTFVANSVIQTGANSAISHGSAGFLQMSSVVINTSNVVAIAGAGAGNLSLGNITFEDRSVIAGTITQNYLRTANRTSSYIVGPTGNFETIQAALDAATATGLDETVIVQPGTYTEDLTLYTLVDILGNKETGTTIAGTHIPPAAGRCSIYSCTLTDATDIFNSAVAGTANLLVEDCIINCTNGYTFNLLNWTGDIGIYDSGDVSTANGFINNTGGSTVTAVSSELGVGAGNVCIIDGALNFRGIEMRCPITCSGAAVELDVDASVFLGTITTAGTTTLLMANSVVQTVGAAAINHGSGNPTTLSSVVINTNNNPAIAGAGAGVLSLGTVTFEDIAVLAGTLTLAYNQTTTGLIDATGAHLINSGAAADITFTMGDNAGANGVIFNDLAGNPVLTIDSNGGITPAGDFAVVGAFTQTAGIVNIGADAAANAVNIATGAAAKVLTLGSNNAASSTDILAGTGNFTLEGNVATTYAISGAGVNTGLITIGGGTGAQTLEMMNVAGVKTVNLANGVDGNTVSILNGVNTGAQILNLASGANAANSTVNVLGGVATAGVQTLNLATGASASLVNIGNAIGATAIAITSGTGNIALTSTGAGDILIDSDDTLLMDADGVIEINSTAGIIGIGSDADAFGINIGTGAAQRDITIGNVTGTTLVAINSGTAGITMASTGAGDILIDSDDTLLLDSDGVLELNSSAGIIGIGNDADAFAINVGTGAAAREVTIGNNTGASGVTITSGTGNIDLNGTIENVLSKFVTRTGDDITFTQSPLTCTAANTGGVATGATGDLNLLSFQEGMIMEQFVIGAGETIIKPVMTATGLLVSGDETNLEGFEYNFGAARANSRHSFTIGTSPAFFLEWTFRADDISGLEPCYCGFRRTQANQAQGAIALYTDFVAYGPNDGISPGDAAISTQLNTGGLINTDTNDAWADTATHTLGIQVDGAGVVTFTFDGGAPTATQAYTFDNGDVVHPFFRFEFNAVLPDAIEWIDFQCGFQ